jgi:hypothetical protein
MYLPGMKDDNYLIAENALQSQRRGSHPGQSAIWTLTSTASRERLGTPAGMMATSRPTESDARKSQLWDLACSNGYVHVRDVRIRASSPVLSA